LNNFILSLLKIKPHLIPAGPKKLAALFGMIFCICILLSDDANDALLTRIFVGFMALFSSLEFSVSFCVATLIYNAFLKKSKL
jgi:hypothetical protein